ncbi:MAG: hypothetical protein ACRD19_16095 [Terriglobia bacterium]
MSRIVLRSFAACYSPENADLSSDRRMGCLKAGFVLLLFATLCCSVLRGEGKSFIDWKGLSNPVLSYPNWSIKDAAMAYRDGTFYVFFSAFYEDNGRVRSHVAEVSTRDFKHYSKPILDFDGEEEGWIGMCSPDVQRLGKQYVITFNSWGNQPGRPNKLFYMSSLDLVHWSKRRTLAQNLTGAKSVIDASVAEAGGGYYLIWKERSPAGEMRPRLGFGKALDRPFTFVGNGFPSLLMKDGKENGLMHENYEFVYAKNHLYLLTTDYAVQGPHINDRVPQPDLRWVKQGPRLYALEPGSRWLKWIGGSRLDIPEEKFNTVNRDNAAALYGWCGHDGYYYLIYAGVTERQTYAGRGWNQLGLARSRDLVHWMVAGHMGPGRTK